EILTGKETKAQNQIRLEHGQPIVFGSENEKGVRLTGRGSVEIVDVADVGLDNLLVHDEHRMEPSLAFMLAHLSTGPTAPTPIGIFRDIDRAAYGDAMEEQIATAKSTLGDGDLAALLGSGDTWEIS